MKPGPKPKPADLKKLRRSFRLSRITVARLQAAVSIKSAKDMTEAVEKAVEKWWEI